MWESREFHHPEYDKKKKKMTPISKRIIVHHLKEADAERGDKSIARKNRNHVKIQVNFKKEQKSYEIKNLLQTRCKINYT